VTSFRAVNYTPRLVSVRKNERTQRVWTKLRNNYRLIDRRGDRLSIFAGATGYQNGNKLGRSASIGTPCRWGTAALFITAYRSLGWFADAFADERRGWRDPQTKSWGIDEGWLTDRRLGHVLWMDNECMSKQALCWELPRYKSRPDRPQTDWRNTIKKHFQKTWLAFTIFSAFWCMFIVCVFCIFVFNFNFIFILKKLFCCTSCTIDIINK